jgi:hypothetical protein
MKDENKVVASVIYFNSHVEKERVERWIKKLMEEGHVEGHITREYNPMYGSPTWYIP